MRAAARATVTIGPHEVPTIDQQHDLADLRPTDKYIWENPLGAGSGGAGNLGAVKWGLAPAQIAERFSTAADLVAAVIDAYEKASVDW